jgi:hypothetical protein
LLLVLPEAARAAPKDNEEGPATLTSPHHDPDWPVKKGELELADWEKASASTYKTCMGDHADAVGEPAGNPRYQAAHARSVECLRVMRAERAMICLPPSDTQCRDYDWIASWCGQESRRLAGSNAAWRCTGVMEAEAQVQESKHGRRDVLRPPRVFGPSGMEPSYLERDEGVQAPAQIPLETPRLLAIGRWVALPTRLLWQLNGARVGNCAEYAWEKYFDVNEVLAQGESRAAPGRYYYEQLFTRTPRPLVSSTGDWAVKDRSGASASGPPTIRNTSSPSPIRRSRNLYHELYHLYDGSLRNYYASQDVEETWLTEGLEAYTENLTWHREMGSRLTAAGYDDDELEWLRERQEALDEIHRDFLIADEMFERASNGTLGCPLAQPFGPNGLPPPCFRPIMQEQLDAYGAIRDAKWVVLEAAIQEGFLLGCIVTGPPQWPDQFGTVTPCDWSPSLLAEAMSGADAGRTRAAQLSCEREVGGGPIDNAALHARAIPTTAIFVADGEENGVGFSTAERQTLDAQRNALLGTDPTLSTGAFDAYLVSLRAYYVQLAELGGLNAAPSTALSRSKSTEVDGGNDWFGVGMTSSSSAGLRPADEQPESNQNVDDICNPGGELTAHASHTLKLGPMSLDFEALGLFLAMLAEGADIDLADVPEDPSAIPLYSSPSGSFLEVQLVYDPWDVSLSTGDELEYLPDGAVETSSTTSLSGTFASLLFSVSLKFPMGPLTGKLTVGATAAIGASLSRETSFTLGPEPTTQGTPEQTAACRTFADVRRVAATPTAGIDGFLSFAAGVEAGPIGIYVGVRGTVNLLSVMLPVTLELQTRGSYGLPNTVTEGEFDVELMNGSFWEGYWSALSGRVSVYLEVKLWVIAATIFEWVVLEWSGKTERIDASDDAPPPPVKLCRVFELRSVIPGLGNDPVPDNCNCVIRPVAECEGEAPSGELGPVAP